MHQQDFDRTKFSDEELVSASSETMGGNPSQKSLWSQAELTRRLMQSIRDFDTSTNQYSKRLLDLTILMFFVAGMQLVISILALPFDVLNKTLMVISVIVILGWLVYQVGNKK